MEPTENEDIERLLDRIDPECASSAPLKGQIDAALDLEGIAPEDHYDSLITRLTPLLTEHIAGCYQCSVYQKPEDDDSEEEIIVEDDPEDDESEVAAESIDVNPLDLVDPDCPGVEPLAKRAFAAVVPLGLDGLARHNAEMEVLTPLLIEHAATCGRCAAFKPVPDCPEAEAIIRREMADMNRLGLSVKARLARLGHINSLLAKHAATCERCIVHVSSDSAPDRPARGFLTVVRWISFFPIAVVGGLAAGGLVTLINHFTMGWSGIDHRSFFGRLYGDGAANMALGVAAIYIGAKVAPGHKSKVALGVAAFLLVWGGLSLFPTLANRDWWGVYGWVAMILAAGITAWSVHSGEVPDSDFK